MNKTPNIVPPQPRRYLVMRRVRMERCQNMTLLSGSILIGYAFLAFAFKVIQPIWWLAPALLILMGVLAACWVYYARTEAPTQVEVLEYEHHRTFIIH